MATTAPRRRDTHPENKPRLRKLTRRMSKKRDKRIVSQYTPIPNSFRLIALTFKLLKKHWKVLSLLTLTYVLLNVILAGGASSLSTGLSNLRTNDTNSPDSGFFSSSFSGLGVLAGGSGSGSSSASVFQGVLFVIQSLVVIWVLRNLLANKAVSIKQAYYESMTPLVPFLLIILVIILQLLPFTLGSALVAVILSAIVTNEVVAVTLFTLVFTGLAVWTAYMLASTIMALYIVTLPGMTPRKALRSAKQLVHLRRWLIMRRLLFMPLFLIVVIAAITLPLIALYTPLAAVVFYLLLAVAFLFAHSYLYGLYRSLVE